MIGEWYAENYIDNVLLSCPASVAPFLTISVPFTNTKMNNFFSVYHTATKNYFTSVETMIHQSRILNSFFGN